ncbi:hypothetical protein BU038_08555, partial [Staphylococcus simulans]|uniref:hypothetical protein n=1 Tax=Staphylococcus simulans TaxID=1286 RepID=UPI000D4B2137
MHPNIYKVIISVIFIGYILISLFVYFNEPLTSFLFVVSFLLFVLLLIKPLVFNISLHIFNYDFRRLTSKLSKNNQSKTTA